MEAHKSLEKLQEVITLHSVELSEVKHLDFQIKEAFMPIKSNIYKLKVWADKILAESVLGNVNFFKDLYLRCGIIDTGSDSS